MKIIELAKTFIGQKELPGNKFDSSTVLGQMLHEAGQRDGEAWCCYIQEALWCKAYPEHAETFKKLFSANCVKTLENFKKAGYAVSMVPTVGALMIMRKYKDDKGQTSGHAGLVEVVSSKTLWTSLEGNTNFAGSREGEAFLPKRRRLVYPTTGLRVEGFVKIIETLKIST